MAQERHATKDPEDQQAEHTGRRESQAADLDPGDRPGNAQEPDGEIAAREATEMGASGEHMREDLVEDELCQQGTNEEAPRQPPLPDGPQMAWPESIVVKRFRALKLVIRSVPLTVGAPGRGLRCSNSGSTVGTRRQVSVPDEPLPRENLRLPVTSVISSPVRIE